MSDRGRGGRGWFMFLFYGEVDVSCACPTRNRISQETEETNLNAVAGLLKLLEEGLLSLVLAVRTLSFLFAS